MKSEIIVLPIKDEPLMTTSNPFLHTENLKVKFGLEHSLLKEQ